MEEIKQEDLTSDDTSKFLKDEESTPKLYKRRWLQLVIYGFCLVTGNVCLSTYTSAGTLMMEYYHLGETQNWKINLAGFIQLFIGVFLSFIVSFILQKKGLKACLLIFSFLTCVGCFIRIGGIQGDEISYWISFGGQIILVLGQPFLNQASYVFGMLWFGNNERTIVMAFLTASGGMGSLIGSLVGPHLMTVGSVNSQELKISTMGIGIYLGLQAILSVVCTLLVLIFFKSKPPTPPVYSKPIQNIGLKNEKLLTKSLLENTETVKEESNDIDPNPTENEVVEEESKDVYPKQTLTFGLKRLLKSPSYLMLLTVSSLISAGMQSITILEQIVKKNNYNAIDAGNLSIVLTVFGTVSSFVLGFLCDKTKQFKLIVTIITISGSLGFIWFCILMLWEKNLVLLILSGISFSLIGSFLSPSLQILSQIIIYSTYPIHPSTSTIFTTLFLTVCTALSMIFTNVLLSTTSLAPTIILYSNLGMLVLASMIIVCVRVKLSELLVK